jgi:hypothetical protein
MISALVLVLRSVYGVALLCWCLGEHVDPQVSSHTQKLNLLKLDYFLFAATLSQYLCHSF